MTTRLASVTFMAAALLLTQVSCSDSRWRPAAASGAKPLSLPSIRPKPPRRSVAVTDEMIIVKNGDRTRVILREDENGDGEPD
jgi:hypothetical protein